MLKVPDKRARNLLDLADHIETVDPDDFNMKSWQTCICGQYLRTKGITYVSADAWEGVAVDLGLTQKQAGELFAPYANGDGADKALIMEHTPKQAAERIRKFAFALVD